MDIELDADSDLEDFENNNQMTRIIKNVVGEDDDSEGDDEESELHREATQFDKKPSSLQSDDCELERKGVETEGDSGRMIDDSLNGFHKVDSRRDDTMVMKVAPADADTVSIDNASEMTEIHKTNLKMARSIMIHDEPITHEYADVE